MICIGGVSVLFFFVFFFLPYVSGMAGRFDVSGKNLGWLLLT